MVIRREYLQRVRTWWFAFATAGVPLLLAGVTLVPIWIGSRIEGAERVIVLVDRTGELSDHVAAALIAGGYDVQHASPDEEGRVRERVANGAVGSFLMLDRETLTAGRARLVTGAGPSGPGQFLIRQAVIEAVLERHLAGAGVDGREVLGGVLAVETVAEAPGGMDEPAFAAAYVGSFVIYIVILIYAVAVMRSVLEEKTSRIVEVILSSLRPWQLMLGKILGVGAVGLTQLAVWVTTTAVLAAIALPAVRAVRPELAQLAGLVEVIPDVSFFVYLLIFFLGGYFIYSALYAAVGAMCSSEEEAQQAQFPLTLLLLMPVLALLGVIENPNSQASVVLSLIPFFSPFLMFVRAAGGVAPLWQVALSILLMALTVLLLAWVAGRIYRVGVLATGKRPSLPELMRWLYED